MNDRQPSFVATAVKTAAEMLLVAALVFGLGWAGARLAEARHNQPVTAGKNGTIRLEIRQSDWAGNVEFVEIPKYSGFWRCSRDWQVNWLFMPPAAGRYEITVQGRATDAAAAGAFVVVVAEQSLHCILPYAAERTTWPIVRVGQVELDSKPYRLEVRPDGRQPGARLDLKSVTITPAAPATQPMKGGQA